MAGFDMEKVAENRCFEGRQLRYKHSSDCLSCDMHFSVFLPPQAEREKVPVLYWLSGLTCTDENFVTKAGAQKYAAEFGVAIVAPDTSPRGDGVADDPDGAYDMGLGAGFYVNATEAPWAEHYQMYDYIVSELPALIGAHFPVDTKRSGIFGHSMGGHGALTIALKNPETYKSVSAFAPICAPTQCDWGRRALAGYLGKDQKTWAEYDTVELTKKQPFQAPLKVDQGSADQFLDKQLKTDLLELALENTGQSADIQYHEGYDHSYFFIATFIREHIRFHAQYL